MAHKIATLLSVVVRGHSGHIPGFPMWIWIDHLKSLTLARRLWCLAFADPTSSLCKKAALTRRQGLRGRQKQGQQAEKEKQLSTKGSRRG